jgi:hypothetical protein
MEWENCNVNQIGYYYYNEGKPGDLVDILRHTSVSESEGRGFDFL